MDYPKGYSPEYGNFRTAEALLFIFDDAGIGIAKFPESSGSIDHKKERSNR
jgi:hypothetical protein